MSKILDLYSQLLNDRERFTDEVFYDEIYKQVCPRLTVVDIGAYQGEFGFYCLPFASKIYAIEPDPLPYTKLVETIIQFELEDKMFPFPIAISGENKERDFYASGFGGSSLINIADNPQNIIKVRTLSLNSFLEENNIDHVDILKIDCESSESEIFIATDIDKALSEVDLIIGEDHGYKNIIKDVLERNKFAVNFDKPGFFARR